MRDELFDKYESELTFIRRLASEFAQKYPKVAGRLHIRDDGKETTDPHVERLIQSFALLTARIRSKMEDEFPEIVESLINLLYPHYLRPIPPLAIAQFQFDPSQTGPTEAARIDAGAVLHSRSSGGISASFRTSYPVSLWPLRIESASLSSVSSSNLQDLPADASFVLRIRLQAIGAIKLESLKIPFLRFFLNGEDSKVHALYELLMAQSIQVEVRSTTGGSSPVIRRLPEDCIQPVGFGPEDAVLPYSDRSFAGYRLLQEYFHFPEKFFFFDVTGLDAAPLSNLGSACEILIFLRDSELRDRIPEVAQALKGDMFQLGCTPIVNLFSRTAEPIRLSQAASEYMLIPDRHRQMAAEVYSVDKVVSSSAIGEETKVYEPFYSLRHTYGYEREESCFWFARREQSMRPDDAGTDVYLSLVDLAFNPKLPPTEVLSVHITCTNRDFVGRLRWQREWGELEGEGLPLVQARCTVPPKITRRPPLEGNLQWRLISHLTLNHLSIVQAQGSDALQEILRLYCFDEEESTRRRIMGITNVSCKSSVSRVAFDAGIAFCRGLDINLEFDEEQFRGSGAYLMASVLERFFALYGTLNSYTRLTATSRQRSKPIRCWDARAGERRLA